MASDNGTAAIEGSARSSLSTDGSSDVFLDAQEEQRELPGAWPATATTAESGRGEDSQATVGSESEGTLERAHASSLSEPSNSSGRVAGVARTTAAGEEEVEALADDATTPTLASTSGENPRRSSLSRSYGADPIAFPPSHAVFPTRRSFDSSSAYGGKSHPYATAKNHFPLVKQPKKSTPAGPSADLAQTNTPASPSPVPSIHRPLDRRTSISSGLSIPSPDPAPSPTARSREASGNILPTVARTKSTPSGSRCPSPPSSDAASTTSGSAGRARPPDRVGVPPPVGSPHTQRTTSPATSQHAPSIAPSSRSTATHTTRRTNPFKPSYTASLAPSYAELHQATSAEPFEGPASIFLNPMPQPRSVTELLPKKKLSSFFSKGKSKLTGSNPSSNSAQSQAAMMNNPSYRGKSATILDAALASSATWAQRRGEQIRMPIGGPFGPPGGYRPAHQVLREQQEQEAGGETPLGPAMMGGGTERPVTGEAIAEAFARNEGRSASRRMSMVSLQSTADIASPAGGAFPVKPRPKPSTEGLQSTREEQAAAVSGGQVEGDRQAEQRGLGIS